MLFGVKKHALIGFVVFVFIICTEKTTQAFNLPEFNSLTENEAASFDSPMSLGSEYQSDILHYSTPFQFHYNWLRKTTVFDFSDGSLNKSLLATTHRLKTAGKLLDYLEIRLTHLDYQNFEYQIQQNTIELITWPTSLVGLSIYGMPSYFKRQDDMGGAILIRPTLNHEIRLFFTVVDAPRLKRTDQQNNYVNGDEPYSYGVVGRWWSENLTGRYGNYVEYAVQEESKTTWRFPEIGHDYHYWKKYRSLLFSFAVSDTLHLNTQVENINKYEEKTSLETKNEVADLLPAVALGKWLYQKWLIWLQLYWHPNFPLDPFFSLGLQHARREWKISELTDIKQTDTLPHISIHLPLGTDRQNELGLGLEVTNHKLEATGKLDIVEDAPIVTKNVQEYRLNLNYTWNYAERAQLALLISFDLDDPDPKNRWEGGAARFQFLH